MTGKDVWRWILTKFDNDVIFQIYEKKKVVCKGFRINKVQDINSNRNRLITNLLNNDNYKKLVLWSAENPPAPLEEKSLMDKELNELVDIAIEKGVTNVLIKLFLEKQERKAVQFYAFLQDEKSDLLNVPNQSIGVIEEALTQSNEMESVVVETRQQPSKQKQEIEVTKSDGKKIQKLVQKMDKLTEELKKRDDIHKTKQEESERRHQHTIQKLNEKNQLYSNLLKEKNTLTKEYEEEKTKWNKERDIYKETIAHLESELMKLQERIKNESDANGVSEEVHSKKKTQILVIGKPAYTTHFQSETIVFSFVEGNDVHDFLFSKDFDAYLVLSYELSNREQFLLTVNDSYSQLDSQKINICKDFTEVRRQINYYSRLEARAI